MTTSGGETFLEVLIASHVKYIFCCPGSEWVPVWEGLAKLLLSISDNRPPQW